MASLPILISVSFTLTAIISPVAGPSPACEHHCYLIWDQKNHREYDSGNIWFIWNTIVYLWASEKIEVTPKNGLLQ